MRYNSELPVFDMAQVQSRDVYRKLRAALEKHGQVRIMDGDRLVMVADITDPYDNTIETLELAMDPEFEGAMREGADDDNFVAAEEVYDKAYGPNWRDRPKRRQPVS